MSSRGPREDQSMLENFRANVFKKQEIPQMVGLTKEFLIGFLAEPTSREILYGGSTLASVKAEIVYDNNLAL